MSKVERRLERLVEAGIRISSEHSVRGVLGVVAHVAREIIEAKYSAIGILDESGTKIEEFMTSGLAPETVDKIGSFPTGRGLLGTLITAPRPVRVGDLSEHPDSVGFPPHHPPMKSFLGVPVVGRRGPVGNLYLTEKLGADEFTAEDESIAVMFAAQVAVAVDNARLYEETSTLLNEIKDLHKTRERFSSTINHELRNALTAVHGWSDLLLRHLGPNPPKAAIEVFESAEDTLELVDDLLLLNKLDSGRLKPSVRETEFGVIERHALQRAVKLAVEKGVKLETVTEDSGIRLNTDAERLEQIIYNLVTSCIRMTPERETVTVRGQAQQDTLTVTVRCPGTGIEPDAQENLFEGYVEGDISRERGAGLTLPISRRLARFLGGDLRLISQKEEGARFSLQIPLDLDKG